MKTYFTQLLNYDKFENHAILNSMATADNLPEKAVQLFAHLLAAQQRWLGRCNGESNEGVALWPTWPLDSLEEIVNKNHQGWMNYVDTLTDGDFDKKIAYTTSQGIPYTDKLSDIMAHLINHGTHHRAQIGWELKLSGFDKLPATDLILYVRENK